MRYIHSAVDCSEKNLSLVYAEERAYVPNYGIHIYGLTEYVMRVDLAAHGLTAKKAGWLEFSRTSEITFIHSLTHLGNSPIHHLKRELPTYLGQEACGKGRLRKQESES